MKWQWPVHFEKKDVSLDVLLRNLLTLSQTTAGVSITPENCMRSPTVHAIVTAVQNRMAISPIHVLQKSMSKGREMKEPLPDHVVSRLLRKPNSFQTIEDYVSDATSSLLRWGRFHASISRGQTGPIQELLPLHAGDVEVVKRPDTWRLFFRYQGSEIQQNRMHYVRLGARDYYTGDSPVDDVKEEIGLEIAAEQFAASFFGNGALPIMFFKLMDGFKDFGTNEEKMNFLEKFKAAFSGDKKFSVAMLPKGMDYATVEVDHEKAQFIETRKFIRTVIAGAWGVPPHLVGDLERATFNNVEQQDTDFVINVVMPIAKRIEAAMERDLLTDADRRAGVIVRFNLDAVQRADSKTRSESLKIEREMGVINVNEWREQTNRNPIADDDGGEDYIRPMNMVVPGQEKPVPEKPVEQRT